MTLQEPRGRFTPSGAHLRGLWCKAEGSSAGSKARKRTLQQQESSESRVSKWTSHSLDLPSNRKRVEVGWGQGDVRSTKVVSSKPIKAHGLDGAVVTNQERWHQGHKPFHLALTPVSLVLFSISAMHERMFGLPK